MSFLLVTSLIIAGLTTITCEKDEETSERFKLLTAHAWNFDTVFTICQNPEIIWIVGFLQQSFQGMTITYHSNGTFASADGNGEVFESGKWKFSNEETEVITFDEDDPSDIYGHVRIDLLTEDVLEITDMAEVPPSDTCWLKMKLVK